MLHKICSEQLEIQNSKFKTFPFSPLTAHSTDRQLIKQTNIHSLCQNTLVFLWAVNCVQAKARAQKPVHRNFGSFVITQGARFNIINFKRLLCEAHGQQVARDSD